MRKHSLIIPCLISMVFYSCSDQNEVQFGSGKNSHVYFAVDDFIPENQTRTNCDPNNNYKITWASGDAIGIFPREGDQEPFVIPAEQVGQSKAAFDGGYWALKDGKSYNAYYPFSRENYASADMKTQIPVSYLDQYQNDRECNAGAFDYTYSDWKTSIGGASVSFSFHHLGSFLVLHLPIPADATYTTLTLNAENAVIPTTGTYDLTATTPSFISKTKASSLSMQLNGFTGLAGENATFYMMVPPMNLSSETMTVSLSTETTSCTYSIESKNILASKLYQLTGTPVSSTVEGTVDDWLPDTSIPYLTFHADATQTLKMSKAVATLEYSVNDGDWTELGTNTVTFGGSNGDLQLRGKSSMGTASGTTVYSYSFVSFGNSSSQVSCSGDIRTLVDYENYQTADCSNARFCYLFKDCASLVTAPELPAMSLADHCYYSMFLRCSSLATVPELPATTLADDCYNSMFYACTSLTTAPELPATTLAKNCYESMFNNCILLATAPELPATTLADHCYTNMFAVCTSLTTAPELPAKTMVNGCYSCMFSDCTSLSTAPVLSASTLANNCYSNMFSGCTSLTIAPELPAKSLANGCYGIMFYGCTSLSTAPVLPATTLAESCYADMFNGCTSLTTAPELPVTTLAEHCYEGMFSECTSLTTAPALPATTLAENCYSGMFINCTSLTVAPELPATTLANDCYYSMFYGCTSLTKAPELPATTLAENCYSGMFFDCTSLVTAPELPATTLVESCYASMFSGCSSLNYIKMLATDITASSCLYNWTRGVASSGTFVKNPAATWDRNGVSGIPTGWTVRNAYPKYNGHEYVDLGLKDNQGRTIYWATCNVGATSPEDYGDYFAWGDTEPYYLAGHSQDNPCSAWRTGKTEGYCKASYKWYSENTDWMTKYSTDRECGPVDRKVVLESADDAATVNWGGNWRMPTKAEQDQLRTSCTWKWDSTKRGYTVTSSNGNSIFLPAAGHRWNKSLDFDGTRGWYWSSSLDTDPCFAVKLDFNSAEVEDYYHDREEGLSVRAVCILSE